MSEKNKPLMQPSVLSSFGIIQLSGEERISYLQGQLTCDMQQLTANNGLSGAHCNAKGKMWSNFLIIPAEEILYMVMHKAVLPHSLAALKKYAVFSKVELSDISATHRLIAHPTATEIPTALGSAKLLDDCQFSVLTEAQAAGYSADETAWLRHFIQAGYPWLASEQQLEQYVPQMLNLDKLEAVSFSKGCYIGQETVARMRYLGKQNRALYRLHGQAEREIVAGDNLELALDESWKRIGTVINAVQAEDGSWQLLAVLPAEMEADAQLRLLDAPQSQLQLS